MAHRTLWLKLGLFCAVFIALLGTGLALSRTNEPTPTPLPQHEEVAVTTRAAAPFATVGEWQGKLAVFKTGQTMPNAVYDVFIASLPPAEQEALYVGIAVYTERELQGLLEDYTG